MSFPKTVLQLFKHAVFFDSVCSVIAVLATILSIVRFVGNLTYPLWVNAPWAIVLVLLSISIITHMFLYLPVVSGDTAETKDNEKAKDTAKSAETKGDTKAKNDDESLGITFYLFLTIGSMIGAIVQFFHHSYGYLSVESLVFLIALLIADVFVGVPSVDKALSSPEEPAKE